MQRKKDGLIILEVSYDATGDSFTKGDVVFFIHPSKNIFCKGIVKDITTKYAYVLCTDIYGSSVNLRNRIVKKRNDHILKYSENWHSPTELMPSGDIVFYVGNEKHFGYYSAHMESFYSYKLQKWIDFDSVHIFAPIPEFK